MVAVIQPIGQRRTSSALTSVNTRAANPLPSKDLHNLVKEAVEMWKTELEMDRLALTYTSAMKLTYTCSSNN